MKKGNLKNVFSCKCCGRELKDFRCDYCFLELPVDVGGTDIDKIVEQHMNSQLYKSSPAYLASPEYRRENLEKIGDISLKYYKYGWDEKKQKFGQIGKPEYHVIVKFGKELLGSDIIWSDQDFGQTISDDIKERELEFEYTFNGEKKTLKCNITPVKCDDFWHVGLKITDQLKLIVYLGRENKYAESKPIDLELK